MRFWDSSALVSLALEEPRSARCRDMVRHDQSIVVWALTRTEMVSAVRRKQRQAEIDDAATKTALRRIDLLSAHWTEVDALVLVRERAERLLATHALHAADALQLAAALILVDERPRRVQFVTADETLAQSAGKEGFEAIVPE